MAQEKTIISLILKNILKLEQIFFYILIFSIPFQTRVIWRAWGIGFSEWNSAFLYWTDLLILAVLGLWFLRIIFKKGNFIFSSYDWFLIGFLIVSAISIKNASNQILGFYQLSKLLEFSLLYFYIKSNLEELLPGRIRGRIETLINLKTAFFTFFISGIFQSILSIIQFLKQSDLGLRFLGETVLSPDLFNVAVFVANGEKIMRPYGTTPHPNVLAMFLFMAVFIYYFFYIDKNRFSHSKLGLTIYSVLLFGFLLTFSRIIIFAWVIGVGLRWSIFSKKFRFTSKNLSLKSLTVTTLAVLIIFSALFWPQILERLQISTQEEAVSLRGFYNKVSLFEKPFFGVGLGNFVNWFREKNPGLSQNLYQPVHNIYLLIFSEIGILGIIMLLLFSFFLIRNFLKEISFNKPFHYSLLIFFISILFLGLFDHFLWTLQQGQIILWLVLGLIGFSQNDYLKKSP